MRRRLLYVLFLFCPLMGQAQAEFGLDLHTGFGLNSGTEFYGSSQTESLTLVSQVGGRVEFGFLRKYRLEPETGIAVKYIHTNGQIGASYFTYNTLRLLVPVGLKFAITERWNVAAGSYIQNNHDLLSMETGQAFNFRFDAYLQGSYQYSNRFAFSLRYQHALTNPGGAAFIQDPAHTLMGGITCYLNPAESR